MGSGNSKRNQVSASQLQWLQQQDPSVLAALISAARRQQNHTFHQSMPNTEANQTDVSNMILNRANKSTNWMLNSGSTNKEAQAKYQSNGLANKLIQHQNTYGLPVHMVNSFDEQDQHLSIYQQQHQQHNMNNNYFPNQVSMSMSDLYYEGQLDPSAANRRAVDRISRLPQRQQHQHYHHQQQLQQLPQQQKQQQQQQYRKSRYTQGPKKRASSNSNVRRGHLSELGVQMTRDHEFDVDVMDMSDLDQLTDYDSQNEYISSAKQANRTRNNYLNKQAHYNNSESPEFWDVNEFKSNALATHLNPDTRYLDFFNHKYKHKQLNSSYKNNYNEPTKSDLNCKLINKTNNQLRENISDITNKVEENNKKIFGKKSKQLLDLETMDANDTELDANITFDQEHGLSMGLFLNLDERKKYSISGLLPEAIQDRELQIKWVLNYLDQNCASDPLVKYIFLRNLKDFNETLFYATLIGHVEKLMPIVYTPVVGLACQKFSSIYMRPRGLFISSKDLGNVNAVLANCKQRDVRVIVLTDGERILGLGDLGANGMGISIGKLSLYTALAGVPPNNVLPVCLDTGTNNQHLLKDPFYIGLREKRIRGDIYDQLIDEFFNSVVCRWGRSCLIQFEDFANQNAFRLLEKHRRSYCTFNDDIQGTASVCLAGLLSSCRLINRKLADSNFLFFGAGSANLGVAKLLALSMMELHGLSREEANGRIWITDSLGLILKSRPNLSEEKAPFAKDIEQANNNNLINLVDIIELVKPLAIIGASAQAGAFNEQVCRLMANINERPIIFALSNPTDKAECTAKQAIEWTSGKCLFASGSPFEPVEYEGKRHMTGQGNNAYIFPAVGLASIAAHLHSIPEETFLIAAQALSEQVTNNEANVGLVYPHLSRIRECTLKVATRLLEFFYAERLATYRPEPQDKLNFLRSIQYEAQYEVNRKLSAN